METCCKLEIFVPETHFEAVREALWAVDAGHIGRYDHCMSYSRVMGTWRPLPGSTPYLGAESQLSEEPEVKIEVVCFQSRVEETLEAVKAAHPYEEPVINVLPLLGTGL